MSQRNDLRFFFFGTMMDPDVMEIVVGRRPPRDAIQDAVLPGHQAVKVSGQSYPMLMARAGAEAPGVVVEGLDPTEVARIEFFECDEYRAEQVRVECRDGSAVKAWTFAALETLANECKPWSLGDWQRTEKPVYLEETRIWMALHGRMPVAKAVRAWNAALAAGRPLASLLQDAAPATR